jgi:hypothetical protein
MPAPASVLPDLETQWRGAARTRGLVVLHAVRGFGLRTTTKRKRKAFGRQIVAIRLVDQTVMVN